MGLFIEAEGKITYTVHLTDEDVELVKQWIKEHNEDLPSFDMKENIAHAVKQLYHDGKIYLYDENKAIESDYHTENVRWSWVEAKEPEEIL